MTRLAATEALDTFLRRTLAIDDAVLRDVGVDNGRIPLHTPLFRGNEKAYLAECVETTFVSSVGAFVTRFEEMMARQIGTRYAVACVNGTAALHVALHALGVGRGQAVLCPALTFVATANAISYTGATPIFVDSDPTTLGVDVDRLATFLETRCTRRDGAAWYGDLRVSVIVPVHVFGHPVDLDRLLPLCAEWNLEVVDDATEALGSTLHDRPIGGFGRCGAFSFNGNKIITTGGGGMVTTDDPELGARLKHLTTTARLKRGVHFEHDEVGFNYRLPNLNAALGCAQMEQLPGFLAAKRRLAAGYRDLFAGVEGVTFVDEPSGTRSNFWLAAVLFDDLATRDRFLDETAALGFETRPCWTLMCDLAPYANAPRADDLCGARSIWERLVNIPSSAWMMRD
ncbi:MAG: LegC family aminotransferase [Siculibacillus sp.]|nr:LegC family aminotransferase [Siculibacillus sp.]